MDEPGTMSLEEFFDHVEYVQKCRRAAGVATVYFMHTTLTPQNVRAVWDDVPLQDVPGEGDVIDMPGMGYMGADAQWRVLRQEEMHGAAFTVYVTDTEAKGDDR